MDHRRTSILEMYRRQNVVHIVRQPGKIYGLALYVIVMKNDRKIQLEYNKIWHLNENEHVPA
jgi:hypothetical protein